MLQAEKILNEYTNGSYYDVLVAARSQYCEITGSMDEDRDDYEARMNCFSDWYLFNYRLNNGRRIIDQYIEDHKVSSDQARDLQGTRYSLYHFVGFSLSKKPILKDMIADKKITLSKHNGFMGLVKNDLFVSRVMSWQDENYLLQGLCMLPYAAINNLKKQAKAVRKEKSVYAEESFLQKVENLRTRASHYPHINASKIFVFN